mgnify:CR=1 FL=1|jgi:hypothetical protein
MQIHGHVDLHVSMLVLDMCYKLKEDVLFNAHHPILGLLLKDYVLQIVVLAFMEILLLEHVKYVLLLVEHV